MRTLHQLKQDQAPLTPQCEIMIQNMANLQAGHLAKSTDGKMSWSPVVCKCPEIDLFMHLLLATCQVPAWLGTNASYWSCMAHARGMSLNLS